MLRKPPGAVLFTGVTGPTKYSNTAESRSQNTDKNGRQALCPGRPPDSGARRPTGIVAGPLAVPRLLSAPALHTHGPRPRTSQLSVLCLTQTFPW